jgi:hypothetical protein
MSLLYLNECTKTNCYSTVIVLPPYGEELPHPYYHRFLLSLSFSPSKKVFSFSNAFDFSMVEVYFWSKPLGVRHFLVRRPSDENRTGCFGFSSGGTVWCYLSYRNHTKSVVCIVVLIFVFAYDVCALYDTELNGIDAASDNIGAWTVGRMAKLPRRRLIVWENDLPMQLFKGLASCIHVIIRLAIFVANGVRNNNLKKFAMVQFFCHIQFLLSITLMVKVFFNYVQTLQTWE